MATTRSLQGLEQRIDALEERLDEVLALLRQGGAASGGMTEIELDDEELDGISDAIESIENKLSDRQRLYLLGIFGAAAHHLEGVASKEGRVENLRKIQVDNLAKMRAVHLSDAFAGLTKVEQGRLGNIGGGTVQDAVGVGVGVACVGVDWSKDLDKVDVGGWRTNPAFRGGTLTNPVNPGGLGGLPGGFGR
ncbi:hypothetical protein [Futiania mangrovi]|uniref:Uncharacterized protein n=1 Tax=Futiania mangrovi TaxID=2959716 RepID=A0A9J6PIV7_9PROT|nr:hypothetical protein [Futiania mangrovii]MCP1337744.1 hypothetical protein [Futiania mangrovii]